MNLGAMASAMLLAGDDDMVVAKVAVEKELSVEKRCRFGGVVHFITGSYCTSAH